MCLFVIRSLADIENCQKREQDESHLTRHVITRSPKTHDNIIIIIVVVVLLL